jgi:lipopolysaccharide heptosyltransferase II
MTWSIEPACLPLVHGYPGIDGVIVFERQRGWKEFFPFLARVRAEQFDLVLDLQRHFKSGIVSWWSGAAQRIGFNRADCKEFNWVFNNLHIDSYGDSILKLDHYLKFAEFLGIASSPVEWQFSLSAEEDARVDRHLVGASPRFAVLFVGTRWESKQWFPEQMARCAELLRREFQLDTVLLGAPDERELALAAVAAAQTPLVNRVGHTSLREALGIVQRAAVAVGTDTGLMHVAAAVQTPVISLWGATSPERTGPYGFADLTIQGKAPCAPCNRRNCNIGRICLESITTEQIGQKLVVALGRTKTKQFAHAYPS